VRNVLVKNPWLGSRQQRILAGQYRILANECGGRRAQVHVMRVDSAQLRCVKGALYPLQKSPVILKNESWAVLSSPPSIFAQTPPAPRPPRPPPSS